MYLFIHRILSLRALCFSIVPVLKEVLEPATFLYKQGRWAELCFFKRVTIVLADVQTRMLWLHPCRWACEPWQTSPSARPCNKQETTVCLGSYYKGWFTVFSAQATALAQRLLFNAPTATLKKVKCRKHVSQICLFCPKGQRDVVNRDSGLQITLTWLVHICIYSVLISIYSNKWKWVTFTRTGQDASVKGERCPSRCQQVLQILYEVLISPVGQCDQPNSSKTDPFWYQNLDPASFSQMKPFRLQQDISKTSKPPSGGGLQYQAQISTWAT